MKLIDNTKVVSLAVGDALGTTIEFKPLGTFEPITECLVAAVSFDAGKWTDDTSMALCRTESLIEKNQCGAVN